MEIEIKRKPYYESRLYIGSQKSDLTSFDQSDLEKYIRGFQSESKEIIPVRITPIVFLSGNNYREDGWEISAINYPKIDTNSIDIESFMNKLAKALLDRFDQKRVCVVDSNQIVMYVDKK